MNTQTLLNTALTGLDYVGYRLDQLGITARVNRHNLAAFLMAEQYHLEGEWDSLQAKIDRRKSDFDALRRTIETRTDSLLGPVRALRNKF